MSFIPKLKHWKAWGSVVENEIMTIITRLIDKGTEVEICYVKAHKDNEANNAVDQLIQDAWDKHIPLRNTNIPTAKSKSEVASQVKQQMEKDETEIRNDLRRTQDSASSHNIHKLKLTKTKFQKWIKESKHDRPTQAAITTTITDTAFKYRGDRLQCPHCPGEMLDMVHMIEKCHEYDEDRRDAIAYTRMDHKGRNPWTHTDLYTNFCASACNKILQTTKEARKRYKEQNGIQTNGRRHQ